MGTVRCVSVGTWGTPTVTYSSCRANERRYSYTREVWGRNISRTRGLFRSTLCFGFYKKSLPR
jgi:hypothetical protein